jgi:hypothetical protein
MDSHSGSIPDPDRVLVVHDDDDEEPSQVIDDLLAGFPDDTEVC